MSTKATYFIMLPSGHIEPAMHTNVRMAVNEMKNCGGISLLDRGDLKDMRERMDYLLGYVLPTEDNT